MTTEAVSEIARQLEGHPETVGVRIFVRGFGWGGPSFGLALEEPQERDLVIKQEGARVYLERRVADAYDGAELGWESDEWGGGFTFKHPDLGVC